MKKIILLTIIFIISGCINNTEYNNTFNFDNNNASIVLIGVENGFAGKCTGVLKDIRDMTIPFSMCTSNIVTLTDNKATANNVIAAMENAVKSDFAIIYFSGHGGSVSTSDIFETDGKDEYICCYDKGVVDNRIWEIICRSKGRVFLIFDCCHSETMFRSPGITFKSAIKFKSVKSDDFIPNMLCWSGCPDNSYSYGSTAGGEFTTALLKYMAKDRTYDEVWNNISSDKNLKSHQIVKQTKIGNFDTSNTKFLK